MNIYRKIRVGCNFATLKKIYDMLKNGIFLLIGNFSDIL